MKRKMILTAMMLLCCVMLLSAKNIQSVIFKTAPEMHCSSCENRIKSGLKFEKGVKDIVTDLTKKTITVTYDADKTSPEKLIEAFDKINYTASVFNGDKNPDVIPKADSCCGGGGCKCGSKSKADDEKAAESQQSEKEGCACCSKKQGEKKPIR